MNTGRGICAFLLLFFKRKGTNTEENREYRESIEIPSLRLFKCRHAVFKRTGIFNKERLLIGQADLWTFNRTGRFVDVDIHQSSENNVNATGWRRVFVMQLAFSLQNCI